MSTERDCPSCDRMQSAPEAVDPACRPAVDDEVLAWISGPAEARTASDETSCPTCGFAGEMVTGPNDLTCPACLASYPRFVGGRSLVLKHVRCTECSLVIGVTDDDWDRTIICPRCKYFLGCVLRRSRRRHWSSWTTPAQGW